MAIDEDVRAQILRYFHVEHWRVGTIARQLRVHHSTVERVLRDSGVSREKRRVRRPSMLDDYVPFIVETLARFPTLTASRLYEMVRSRGYTGGPDHFRHRVAELRPRRETEAYLRLRTLPGEQAQVDWAHFGHLDIGKARRPLMAFVMVLSYSRQVFLRFYLHATLANLVRGHVDAFAAFNGVSRVVLYDNMASVVLERRGDAIRFHPTLLSLSAHYRYQPRPVAPARGNEKGRVERMIRFVRERFFAARHFRDLDDLNAQAAEWCQTVAADRPCPEDRARSVAAVFAQEREHLLALPQTPFPSEERVEVQVAKTPYVRFDGNDYSVPHGYVERTLTVFATLETVRIVDADEVVAEHPRCFERGRQIEDAKHIEALVRTKRNARAHRAQDRLHQAAPACDALFERVALHGGHLGVLTRGLLQLLELHGADALQSAVAEALEQPSPSLGTVRQLIDQRRHASGQPPPLPLKLPDDPRIKNATVRPLDLSVYDRLHRDDAGAEDDDDDNR
jgi:transposase